jgi:chromosome segregation ATPase
MRGPALLLTMVVAVLAAGTAPTAIAQTTRSGGQNAQLAAQMQQLMSERASLQAENARLKQELDETKKRAESGGSAEAALKQRAAAAEANASRLASSNAATTESLARTRTQMDELVAKFRETAVTLKQVETERNELRTARDASDRALTTCRDHNAGLLNLNEEVLVRLENTGFWSKLAADEPFTRLKRTQLENLAGDYRVRAQELKEAQAKASDGARE